MEVLQLCRSALISWADMVLAPSVAALFKWGCQFEPEMILLAVGWYLRSYEADVVKAPDWFFLLVRTILRERL